PPRGGRNSPWPRTCRLPSRRRRHPVEAPEVDARPRAGTPTGGRRAGGGRGPSAARASPGPRSLLRRRGGQATFFPHSYRVYHRARMARGFSRWASPTEEEHMRKIIVALAAAVLVAPAVCGDSEFSC